MLITSIQNPRIKAVAKLLQSRGRRKSGLFLVERDREIQRAIKQGFKLDELYWVPRRWPEGETPQSLWGVSDHRVTEVSDNVMAKMVFSENPQGVVAVFSQKQWNLSDLFNADQAGLWLVTVGIEKPGNFGAIARTAESAGCRGMLVVNGAMTCGGASGGGGVDLYNPSAIRASTGAIFSLPLISLNEEEALALLKEHGVQIITTSDRAKTRWDQVDYRKPTAIVIGPEDTGLSEAWLTTDGDLQPVSIPMLGDNCDSLNASVATGVLLYEAVRQRQG
ncbi:MAG: RNA methyltransferase [Phycisphaeraceae bacterium]|nr:RNA methyltransferase [Phycisphaeraceae bacterium]